MNNSINSFSCGIIGFFFVFLIVFILFLIIRFSKLSPKRIMEVVDFLSLPLIVTILNIVLILPVNIIVIVIGDKWFSPIASSLYLVIACTLVHFACERLEHEIKIELQRGDKNFCNVVANVWIFIQSIILYYRNGPSYLVIAASSVSILIGSYISLDCILDKGATAALTNLVNAFRGASKMKSIVSLIGAILFLVTFNVEVIYNIVFDIGFSFGIIIAVILIVILLAIKKKNKGELMYRHKN